MEFMLASVVGIALILIMLLIILLVELSEVRSKVIEQNAMLEQFAKRYNLELIRNDGEPPKRRLSFTEKQIYHDSR